MSGKQNEALQSYDRSLQIDPNYVDAKLTKGGVFVNADRYDEGIRISDEVLQIDPNNAKALYVKGAALQNLGKYNGGKQYWERVRHFGLKW